MEVGREQLSTGAHRVRASSTAAAPSPADGRRCPEGVSVTTFSPALRGVLSQQDGVVTRAQLLEGGVSKAAIRWHSGRTWRVLLPCVYLVGRDTPTERQRLIAALSWAGPRSVLAGPTAARAHGITAADPGGLVHVVVPAPFASRRRGFADVRRTVLDDVDVVHRGPLRLCSPARAAVDAARMARTEDTRAAILIEAVHRGLADIDDLAEWAFRLRTRDAADLHEALAQAGSGAWSVPEAVLLDLVRGSRVLSAAWANPRLATTAGRILVTPDAWFDDVALAVMVHSRRFHASGELWDATVEKDADLVAAGVIVVGVTPNRLHRDPAAVLARIETAYRLALTRPRPDVVATPRYALA